MLYALGLSQLVSTRVSIKAYKCLQMPAMQGRRKREINIILVPNAQACCEVKINTQEKPYNTKPSRADTEHVQKCLEP